MPTQKLTLDFLRTQLIGADATFSTPYGDRLMVYCDYTASGRCLKFVESYLQDLQKIYANTHTEDDITGRSMTRLLHDAEESIKRSVNAGPDGRIVAVGTGATGAIDKFQQIVGVALPPATRSNLLKLLDQFDGEEKRAAFNRFLAEHQPIVFVGPYEHHSNELTWKEGLATVVEVRLNDDGGIDMAHLESLLQDPAYQNRMRIGSFSAASNVTGYKTDVHAVARLLHQYGAVAAFDFAACAPYVEIDMNPDDGHGGASALDAIFISPHKFLGGPGSSGVLVFNKRIYREDLPPSVSGGGTVAWVSSNFHAFVDSIEEREKAGTPGVLQTLKAALAFQIKDRIGADTITNREHELNVRAFDRWSQHPNIEILGNPDPERRVGIVSFNIRDKEGSYLHPKFVTALLNDLFGIQSRAGCSCAGPYGHKLLGIDADRSNDFWEAVQEGHCGMKPGWCRVGLHYVLDDAEADYVIDAVRFVADYGCRFLSHYDFDLATGAWSNKREAPPLRRFSLDAALDAVNAPEDAHLTMAVRRQLYDHYLAEAKRIADEYAHEHHERGKLTGEVAKLQFFAVAPSRE
ncbi:MAG: aminotransferase class V-fold PLP-dependent enzyme [Rhodothermales bacterium]